MKKASGGEVLALGLQCVLTAFSYLYAHIA